MTFLTRALTVPAILLALVVGLQGPALAAGSFTWTFAGDYGVYSRNFDQPRERDIFVKIRTFAPCTVDGEDVDIYLYLYKNDAFDNRVGATKKVTCTGTAKWSDVNPGTYYFRLLVEGQHRDQGTTFRAAGTTYYNGSTP